MARLPIYVAEQGLDTDRGGTPSTRVDQSLGAAIEGLGGAIAGAGERLLQIQQQKETFAAEQSYLRFQSQMGEAYAQAQTQMPDGDGLHDAWMRQYEDARTEFLKSVPHRLQGEYDERTRTFGASWSEQAAVDEYKATGTWYRSGVLESLDMLAGSVAAAGLDGLEAAQREGERLIGLSGLPAAEKPARIAEWRSRAQRAALAAVPPEDRELALADPAFQDMPAGERWRIRRDAEREVAAQSAAVSAVASEGNPQIAEAGMTLLDEGRLDRSWLAANREQLPLRERASLSRALQSTPVAADPADMLALAAAPDLDQAMDLQASGRIGTDDLLRVRRYVSDEPGQVARARLVASVRPEAGAPPAEMAAAWQAVVGFDAWRNANPKADSRTLDAEIKSRTDQHMMAMSDLRRRILPLPLFAGVPRPGAFDQATWQAARKRTVQAALSGVLTEEEAARQAMLLMQWQEPQRG